MSAGGLQRAHASRTETQSRPNAEPVLQTAQLSGAEACLGHKPSNKVLRVPPEPNAADATRQDQACVLRCRGPARCMPAHWELLLLAAAMLPLSPCWQCSVTASPSPRTGRHPRWRKCSGCTCADIGVTIVQATTSQAGKLFNGIGG